jgi:hypothetical protein
MIESCARGGTWPCSLPSRSLPRLSLAFLDCGPTCVVSHRMSGARRRGFPGRSSVPTEIGCRRRMSGSTTCRVGRSLSCSPSIMGVASASSWPRGLGTVSTVRMSSQLRATSEGEDADTGKHLVTGLTGRCPAGLIGTRLFGNRYKTYLKFSLEKISGFGRNA